jgi:hypothetical protein
MWPTDAQLPLLQRLICNEPSLSQTQSNSSATGNKQTAQQGQHAVRLLLWSSSLSITEATAASE